jgi:hypothetical protein
MATETHEMLQKAFKEEVLSVHKFSSGLCSSKEEK